MAGRFSIETVFNAVDRLTAPVTRMQNRVGRFTRSMSAGLRTVNRHVDGMINGLGRGAAKLLKFGTVSVAGLTAAVTLLVREFSKVENAEAAFTPILGGAKKAKELVQALNDTAASTPFQFETLASSATQLLPVMKGGISDVIKTLRMLGDTAGGNAQKLDTITRGFTKAMLKGKVDMESLNMIAEAGVPIFDDLAAVMGTTVGEKFFKTISKGKVTTEQLTAAFGKMTSEGGIFFRGMEIASRTTTGMFSTLMDNIGLTAAALGEVLAPTVKELILGATEVAKKVRAWVTLNKELISSKFIQFVEMAKDAIGRLVSGIKTLEHENSVFDRLARAANAALDFIIFLGEHGAELGKVAAWVVGLIVTLKALAFVLTAVNLVMAANPITLIVLAIALLVAAVAAAIIWWDELKAAFLGLEGMDQARAAIAKTAEDIQNAAAVVMDAWEPVKAFFADLWGGVVDIFTTSLKSITGVVDDILSLPSAVADTAAEFGGGVANFLGFGDDAPAPQVASPQERTAKSIEEFRTTNSTEVTIKDESGRAEVTGGRLGPGLSLQTSGAF